LSRRELSERCGVSERFLAQLESGKGNISLVRFAEVASALDVTPAQLLSGADDEPHRRAIALLGVRGAGKSTVGRGVAEHLGLEFVEADQKIERAAGLSLAEIFDLHGAAYYRRVEREVLQSLLTEGRLLVVATGGSIVTHPENYAFLAQHARTVWLKASAEEHWNRVIEQGDKRPMAENPQAFSELRSLLAARTPLYAAADHVIDTHAKNAPDVIRDVCRLVGARRSS